MKNFLFGLIAALVPVALFVTSPAQSVDIEGRAQALRALQSSVVLKVSAAADKGFCGGTSVADGRAVLTAFHCVKDSIENASRPIYVEPYGSTVSYLTQVSPLVWPGVDLAVLTLVNGNVGKTPQLAPDIAVGETLYLVGAPDSVRFVVSKGIVSRIFKDKFVNCPKTLIIGSEIHQIFAFDGLTWLGNSGGGLFNADGQLAGVLVRLHFTGEQSEDCKASLDIGQSLWGYAVGVDTIREKVR